MFTSGKIVLSQCRRVDVAKKFMYPRYLLRNLFLSTLPHSLIPCIAVSRIQKVQQIQAHCVKQQKRYGSGFFFLAEQTAGI